MFKYNKKLKDRARDMRREMTSQEGVLWHGFLKRHPIKFLRQRIIGDYIVDFYCSSAKLIIEVDGSQHFEEKSRKYDSIRTGYFNSLGIEVVRFANDEIKHNFEAVCILIDSKAKERIK